MVKNNKGGKVIASGGYGCVFNPALKCEDSSKKEPKKISKLMIKRHALEEYNKIKQIKSKLDSIKNYEDYFLINDFTICRPEKLTPNDLVSFNDKCSALPKNNLTKSNINSKLNEVLSLNLPNGGLPVDDYIYLNGKYEKLYKAHLVLMKLLKNGIIPMNKNNIYHSDIKDSNVLIDDKKNVLKARLIDWGLSVEYRPSDDKFPNNWRNRPLQFNVPFSVVIFTDKFYEKYSEYLKNGGKVNKIELKPFIINYLNEWMKERGTGHYKFINEIMFLLYSKTLTSVSESSKPEVIETEITIPFIIDYITDVLVNFTKFKDNGSLNLREYLNNVYIKIVDLWGFIMVYYPFLEMFSVNYFILNEKELKAFKQIQIIFNFLLMPRHEPINIKELLLEFNIFGDSLHILAYGKRKTLSSRSSIDTSGSIKKNTTRRIKTSSIFKRKKLTKKFKNPFFLSVK